MTSSTHEDTFPVFDRDTISKFTGISELLVPENFLKEGTEYEFDDVSLAWNAFWNTVGDMFGAVSSGFTTINAQEDIKGLYDKMVDADEDSLIIIGSSPLGLTVVAHDWHVQCTLIVRVAEEEGPATINIASQRPASRNLGGTTSVSHQVDAMKRHAEISLCLSDHLTALTAD